MEPDMNQSAAAAIPTLCRGGCGFYGSSSTEGLCSKCFKDALKRKQDPARHSPGPGSCTASAASKTTTAGLPTDLCCSNNVNGETNKINAIPDIVETIAHNDFPTSTTTTTTAASDSSPDVAAKPERATAEANSKMGSDLAIPQTLTATASSSDVTQANSSTADARAADPDLHKSSSFPSQKPNRCYQCNKKVGFTGFDCRCGFLFCGIHRYSDMHNCTFDYKSMGADEIRKNNPVVKGEKIQKL